MPLKGRYLGDSKGEYCNGYANSEVPCTPLQRDLGSRVFFFRVVVHVPFHLTLHYYLSPSRCTFADPQTVILATETPTQTPDPNTQTLKHLYITWKLGLGFRA